eukprot:Em0009g814a
MNPLISIADKRTKIKVSSVLNRNVKEFGKNHMFDGCEETCWNSDQGLQQFVFIDTGKLTLVKEIHIRFQGGFSGSECVILAGSSELDVCEIQRLYPADTSSLQISFTLRICYFCYLVY